MKKRFLLPMLAASLLLLALIFALSRPAAASPASQSDPPAHGWEVCAVGGIGSVPGVPDQRQLFELCHPDGWRYATYCLNPGLPLPQIGALCSDLGGGHYWCGDGLQELQAYAMLSGPAPQPAPSVTPTRTPTLRPTARPVQTQVAVQPTPTPPLLPYERPRGGGPGPADVLRAGLLALGLLGSLLALGGRIIKRVRA